MTEPAPTQSAPATAKGSSGKKPGKWTAMADWISRFALVLILCAMAFSIVGFTRFANQVVNTNSVLNSITPDPVDGIVVLTGGQDRIASALKLLEAGKAKRLLISGVHPKTSPKAILRYSGATATSFDCCVDIDRLALDTIGNAKQAALWADGKGFQSLIVVTSAYHMPRSIIEMKRSMPDMQLTAFPVSYKPLQEKNWFSNPHTLKIMITEYIKFLAASARSSLTPGDASTTLVAADVN